MEKSKKWLGISIGLFVVFILWTIIVCFVDVRAIGPQSSSVGLAGINQFVHNLTGVHFTLYQITDWLGLVPIGVCMGFGVLGLIQWIQRKNIWKVDYSILVLGGFYVITIAIYLFFEKFVINFRPVLIEGYLEVSYPSSTTMLVMCVMPTAMMQWSSRIKNKKWKKIVIFISTIFIAFMVIARLLSGVHWFTDIIGGALVSAGLVTMYYAVNSLHK